MSYHIIMVMRANALQSCRVLNLNYVISYHNHNERVNALRACCDNYSFIRVYVAMQAGAEKLRTGQLCVMSKRVSPIPSRVSPSVTPRLRPSWVLQACGEHCAALSLVGKLRHERHGVAAQVETESAV